MTKEEIYEHLAKVYLGKKKTKKKRKSLVIKVLLFVNLFLLALALFFAIAKWNFSADNKIQIKENLLSLTLGNYPLRLTYNFDESRPQVQNFSMCLPNLELRKFDFLVFSIRGLEDKIPRLLKIGLENKKKERSELYFSDIGPKWKKVTIPLSEFKEITDWSEITQISFIFEAWNLDNHKGKVLIDNVSFMRKGGK